MTSASITSTGGGTMSNVRFGTTVPSVLGTDSENDTYFRTSDGTSAGQVVSTWIFDKTSTIWIQVGGDEEVVDVAVTTIPTLPSSTIPGGVFTPDTQATLGITYAISDGVSVIYAKWNGTQYITSPNPTTSIKTKRVVQALVAGNNVIAHNMALITPFYVEVNVRYASDGALITHKLVPATYTTNSVTINVTGAIPSAIISLIELK